MFDELRLCGHTLSGVQKIMLSNYKRLSAAQIISHLWAAAQTELLLCMLYGCAFAVWVADIGFCTPKKEGLGDHARGCPTYYFKP